MTELQGEIIIAFAENDMSIRRTADAIQYAPQNIQYHLERIREKTGLNPRNLFDLVKLYEMATGKELIAERMTLSQAIAYLQPIADSTPLAGYQKALSVAIDAMREVENLREELKDERYRHDRYVDYAVERDKLIDELREVQGDG